MHFRDLNEAQILALAITAEEEDARIRQELARVDAELQANAVLRRRDYAFCLYPEAALRPFCASLL